MMYTAGVAVALAVFIVIGIGAGRRVKDTNDYYVAGRRAPVILLVGSLIASFLSTGAFLGDTGEVYSGFFMGIMIVGIVETSGYVFGSGLFGRFIRRSQANTVPEYFGIRFSSKRIRVLASCTMFVAVTAYLLSSIQGVSTLMSSITGLDYRWCVIIAWLSFTVFTVYSGSMGVLLTDTIMFMVFLLAAVISVPYIVKEAGGWNTAIAELATSTTRPGIIAWTNNLDYLYPSGIQNLIWAVTYGVVWTIVIMVSPWQTSRYLMAKNEHAILRSAVWAAIGVTVVQTALYFSAAFIYKINPDIADGSRAVIWAAMNCVPTVVGVVLLTGILAAGVSSASTFLSLIGSSLTNDIFTRYRDASQEKALLASRVGMGAASVIVLLLAYFNPPQIFWIMYFGGTVIAGSWGVVAITSVWSRRMSETGAFWGMLLGFLGCVVPKTVSAVKGITLPIYADPFFIGLAFSTIGILAGSKLRPAGPEAVGQYEKLHIVPQRDNADNGSAEAAKTHRLFLVYIAFGVLVSVFFVLAYALPYMRAV